MDNTFYNSENSDFVQSSDSKNLNNSEDLPKINPKNPFDNFTELEEYNSNYNEIVPQIDIPGCEIPFVPSVFEKKKIRHFFNLTGGGMLLHFIFAQGVFFIVYLILQHIVMIKDGVSSSDATPQYLSGLTDFFNNSSINIGLNMLVMMICNVLVFLIGSKASNIKISSYFNTKNLTFKTIGTYFIISFFIRIIGGFAGVVFELIFNGADMTVGTEMLGYDNLKTIMVTAVYTCIVAPITEELMYRGFVLKNLSRVSQRFGIIMSSLLFGLMHGNVSQFIFAFFLGLFLAHIDIIHNSLIPSIAVHALANTVSMVLSYSGILDDFFLSAIAGFAMFGFGIAGLVLYNDFHKKNRLPYTMPHQKIRNGTASSSILLILSIAVYAVVTVINSFPDISDTIFSSFS